MFGIGSTEIFIILFIILLPIVIIARSKRTTGNAKVGWIIVSLCLSWFGVAIYYIVYRETKTTVEN
jgi:hypothetical protein